MRRNSHAKWFFAAFFLLPAFLLQASSSLSPEFGVVKSRDRSLFLSCVENADDTKDCKVYLTEKGKEAKALGREIKFSKISESEKGVLDRIESEGKGGGVSPLAVVPVTSGIIFLAVATHGYGPFPLFVFSPLDIALAPIGLAGNGIYLLYKHIQASYLQKAWDTLSGMNKKSSMRLSSKDFDKLVSILKNKF